MSAAREWAEAAAIILGGAVLWIVRGWQSTRAHRRNLERVRPLALRHEPTPIPPPLPACVADPEKCTRPLADRLRDVEGRMARVERDIERREQEHKALVASIGKRLESIGERMARIGEDVARMDGKLDMLRGIPSEQTR